MMIFLTPRTGILMKWWNVLTEAERYSCHWWCMKQAPLKTCWAPWQCSHCLCWALYVWRQAVSPHGQALNLCSGGARCSRLATGVPGLALGSVEIVPCCAVLCWDVRLCLVCAAVCLHIQEPPDNLTVAIFPVNFRTDQILTCFPAAVWWWVSGMHPFRSDGGCLYLLHACAHFVC